MKIIRVFVVLIFVFSISAAAWAQVGKKAVDFTAVSMAGESVKLTSLKGKVVVLVFWSSRCAICQSEIPKLNELAADYSKKDIVFLAATMESEDIVQNYLKNNRFDSKILPNSFGLMLKYSNRDSEGRVNISFPGYYVIDRSGYIQYKDSGWDKTKPLDAAINKVLANR